jgi:pyruvate,water dikinase
MRWIIHPSDPESLLESVAGGKGASLARLRALAAPVPDFLIVSTSAFRSMSGSGISEELASELREALGELDVGAGISVRSSAIGEDDVESSFAGLYHTSLDVRGEQALIDAVERCWHSYGSDAAAAYRRERQLPEDGAMAVVLQGMVHGEWSGVCFTAHPVHLALSQGLINAVPGLGESLVSGLVNPEEITVAAKDGRVLSRRGQDNSALPDDVLASIWETSRDIAERLGFPQDVEWSWANDSLYLLQSRPVTTLSDIYFSRDLEPWRDDPEADPDDPDRVWSRMLADETWVSPISPLFYNVHNSTPGRVQFLRSHGDRSKLPPDMFKYHRATAYVDVRVIRRMYEYQPQIARIRGVRNFLPANLQKEFASARWRWPGRLRRILSYELHDREARSIFRNYRRVAAQWPAYVEKSNRWLDKDLDALTLEELRAHQSTVQKEMATVGPPCAIAVLSHASDLHLLLTGLLERWCRSLKSDGENLYARISSGLDDSETLKQNEQLWNLGQRIRSLGQEYIELARQSDWAAFRSALSSHVEGEEITTRFEAFWRSHRHLGSSYKDLIWPRWGDDIDLCFASLKGYVTSAAERPATIHSRSARSRRDAEREILGSLRGPLAFLRRAILRWLFVYNERYMAIRDNHRYYVDRNWYEVRRIYRSYGSRLVALGVLEHADDVFFLGMKEVESDSTENSNRPRHRGA